MRVIARSLAVAGVVACGALAAGLSSCGSERTPTGEGEVERARTADARLTSPFLEGVGVRDGSPAIRRVRDSLAARIRSWEARDPSLTVRARLDVPKRVEGRETVMDARTYGTLFRVLFNSTWFSRPESEWALDVLASARFQRGIRAGVPPGVTVASKYGVHADPRRPLDGVQLHECGIVYAPRAPYVLCAMTRSTYRAGGLHDLLAELSGVVWRVAGVAPGT
jgi:hypothetical protein